MSETPAAYRAAPAAPPPLASPATAPQGFGSQADFARAQGWERSYVTKLKHAGRLVFTADGLVDFARSLDRIRASTIAPERAAPQVQGAAYASAQDRERFYSSELKRLELERATRTVRDAAEVASVAADAGATVRVTIEGWRDRLAPQLAALHGDEARIHALLDAECQALLQRLAEKLRALAAGEEEGA